MLISIIIPVYNVKDYLERCVDSVLAQDCRNCEIILVDDGSTDGVCPAICDRYAALHPDLIRVVHKENGGLGDARNVGIAQSEGDYLLFLDSDDYVSNEMLDRLRSVLEASPCDLIDFDIAVDTEGQITEVFGNDLPSDSAFTLAEQPRFLLSGPSVCRRLWARRLFTDNQIQFPKRVWYEDLHTSLKLFPLADSIRVLHEPLYYYYVRRGSITHNRTADRNREIIDAFEQIRLWYENLGLSDQYRDELCALCVDNVLYDASVRVLKIDPHHPLLKEFRDYTECHYPDFRKNPYRAGFPAKKKLVYQLLLNKQYSLIKRLLKS